MKNKTTPEYSRQGRSILYKGQWRSITWYSKYVGVPPAQPRKKAPRNLKLDTKRVVLDPASLAILRMLLISEAEAPLSRNTKEAVVAAIDALTLSLSLKSLYEKPAPTATESDIEMLRDALDLLLIGYKGLGGNMEANAPRRARQALFNVKKKVQS